MRKQTKVVAVASAAALLAIGGAMTSFAAQGWVEEDGTWYYYDKDGNRVEDQWKKSGDNWFWLDSEEGGAMATDKLIDDNDNTYYVDGNGVMVTNTWVKVVNEDQDDDDPAEYRYYYMQTSGKAYKAGDNGVKFKTIDGKKYAFDEDGKMLYGWVNKDDSTLATGDTDWEEATYYMGSWEDGALKTGWQKVTVYDEDEDDDMDYWFNFKSNGQKRKKGDNSEKEILEKKINGKYYGFDERGVMTYEWTVTTHSDITSDSNIKEWRYFNSPEDGARATKGWFKVVAPDEDGDDNTFKDYSGKTFAKKDAEDENERWYYADSNGELYIGQIKKIKGKYYGFAPSNSGKGGSMLTGLCALRVNSDGDITKLWGRDMDSDELDDALKSQGDYEGFGDNPNDTLYYFGSNEDADGAMKTGNVSVTLDGDSYQFQFSKTGGAEGKGRGVNGIDDGKYIYKFGMKLKAASDDKYILVYATGDTGDTSVNVHKIDTTELRSHYSDSIGINKDGDTVRAVGTIAEVETDDDGTITALSSNYYLVNTSGTIVKNKSGAKDGNDWYYYVDDKIVKMYTNNNTLSTSSSYDGGDLDDVKKYWDKTDYTVDAGDPVPATLDADDDLVDDGIE